MYSYVNGLIRLYVQYREGQCDTIMHVPVYTERVHCYCFPIWTQVLFRSQSCQEQFHSDLLAPPAMRPILTVMSVTRYLGTLEDLHPAWLQTNSHYTGKPRQR